MLTKEQWQDAARFCGLEFAGMVHKDTPCVKRPPESRMNEIWMPHEDWRDFGPLWVKLRRWIRPALAHCDWPETVYAALDKWTSAEETAEEQELMQAGLLLAAAIGKTMQEGT